MHLWASCSESYITFSACASLIAAASFWKSRENTRNTHVNHIYRDRSCNQLIDLFDSAIQFLLPRLSQSLVLVSSISKVPHRINVEWVLSHADGAITHLLLGIPLLLVYLLRIFFHALDHLWSTVDSVRPSS